MKPIVPLSRSRGFILMTNWSKAQENQPKSELKRKQRPFSSFSLNESMK